MRKTRLVILPTRCLHQMGFLLLFLSCPVIGDWGRIRPESENSHKAIQIDREGTCGLQRDPPGGLFDFLRENGSDQCRLSEVLDSNEITKKSAFRPLRKSDERRLGTQMSTQQRNAQESERRQMYDNKREVRKVTQRKILNERRDFRGESVRDISKEIRAIPPIRRSIDTIRSITDRISPLRQREERLLRNQRLVPPRYIRIDNEINKRNERGRLHRTRQMIERQNELKIEQRRLYTREQPNEAIKEKQDQRLVRSEERERQDNRRVYARRTVEYQSVRQEKGMIERQTRERSQARQNGRRLSLARRVENLHNRRVKESENRRNAKMRLSQIHNARSPDANKDIIEHRMTKSFDTRRNNVTPSTKQMGRDVRERRIPPLKERIVNMKSRRITIATKHQDLPETVSLKYKNMENDRLPKGITKWLNFRNFETFKAGDWTTNCVVGAVIYYLSTRQIKVM